MKRRKDMLIKGGKNGYDNQSWKLTVPDEHCTPGLEVGVVADAGGLSIGDGRITWEELEKAKKAAQAYGQ
jgi:hypothetical protein